MNRASKAKYGYSRHLKTEPWSVFRFNFCPVAKWSGFQMVLTKWLPIMAAILFLASENLTLKVSEK
jgi:hypothetical protein